ncbi:hypothetical protein CB0940_04710 [Cercospora beticola]|uniref:Uncharacterized protein n=1 Tax=Cercospora beticola TaxID=122368 RepID=A0A2G5HLH8_CERBT|nr:hypothetical protein CB0940_04710 [Cercospora beticola]PIA93368.1 hypothetical protein CB0940_04710 [Cercospora beticola]WPB01972.1 hypothetical protein RHO25_006606 [Cercospora beticola]CAK1363179.1 unnamed protein product [Cercospora beticola]
MEIINMILLLSALQSTFAAYLDHQDSGYPLLAPRFDENACKRDVAVWHLNSKHTNEAAESRDGSTLRTTLLSCLKPQLLSTRALAKNPGKNIFNKICQREITGRSQVRNHVVDVAVPINGNVQSINTPGDSGRVELHADTYTVVDPGDPELQREEMSFYIVNRSQCPIGIEFSTELRYVSNRRNDPNNMVANRDIPATPRRNWFQGANNCEIDGIQVVTNVAIAVRLIIEAFGYCGAN